MGLIYQKVWDRTTVVFSKMYRTVTAVCEPVLRAVGSLPTWRIRTMLHCYMFLVRWSIPYDRTGPDRTFPSFLWKCHVIWDPGRTAKRVCG
ncbi:hypothetical protein GBA52_007210 [Prunus armeniaca]|nr:hypothetical protein GBA52_007210 [Prunus armeniaca]